MTRAHAIVELLSAGLSYDEAPLALDEAARAAQEYARVGRWPRLVSSRAWTAIRALPLAWFMTEPAWTPEQKRARYHVLLNAYCRFGAAHFVRRFRSGKWDLELEAYGLSHPSVFKTRRAAEEAADTTVRAVLARWREELEAEGVNP